MADISGRTPAGRVSVRLVMKTAVANAVNADQDSLTGRELVVVMATILKPSH
ncbi:hypothetical protein GCM10009804_58890 [Kribbella hippodromi]|uniref:Uncharacterized protein n=1 Tax=Kribbella hippodromi TaxID=434347 RepID=A0ABN2E2P6_9ACTN